MEVIVLISKIVCIVILWKVIGRIAVEFIEDGCGWALTFRIIYVPGYVDREEICSCAHLLGVFLFLWSIGLYLKRKISDPSLYYRLSMFFMYVAIELFLSSIIYYILTTINIKTILKM